MPGAAKWHGGLPQCWVSRPGGVGHETGVLIEVGVKHELVVKGGKANGVYS